MKCKICSKETQDKGFCPLHLKAYENIVVKFEVWKKASNITWAQYLAAVQKNSLTGEWAKEVAKQLLWEENKDV